MAFLGTTSIPALAKATKTIYKITFRHSALWLQNAGSVALSNVVNLPIEIPLPLLGFVYQDADQLELLKYSYTKNPYLNKQMITLGYTKENTNFAIECYKVITNVNTVPLNIATNMAIHTALEMYCDRGGLFTLITPYGIHKDLALTSLTALKHPDENAPYGIGFRFELEKVLVNKVASSILSSAVSKITGGFL